MQIWLKKIDVGRPRKKGCNQGAQAAAAHGHGGTVHAARELENDEVAHGAAGQKLVPVRAPERAEVTCTMLEVGMLINAGSSTRCCRAGSKNNSLGWIPLAQRHGEVERLSRHENSLTGFAYFFLKNPTSPVCRSRTCSSEPPPVAARNRSSVWREPQQFHPRYLLLTSVGGACG